MHITKIKEDLSICYLKTLSALKGVGLEEIHHDEDSMDVMIKKTIKLDDERKFNSQISIQLKSTSSPSQYEIKEHEIIYTLKVKNYNDLCVNAAMPSILALFILPEDENEWVNWDERELMLRGQMFWLCLQGKPTSSNSKSVSVKIPKTNRISTDMIEALLIKVAEEGEL